MMANTIEGVCEAIPLQTFKFINSFFYLILHLLLNLLDEG